MIVLAADVGGTNARLALADVDGTTVRLRQERRYLSREAPGLGAIVQRFLEEVGCRPERACFGVACLTDGDDCAAANLPWTLNVPQLAAQIAVPSTRVINDFVAVGYGVELLRPADLATLQEGAPEPHAPIALIGAGTGLGQGVLLWDRNHYRSLPSEGGHADFAPQGALQAGLLEFLRSSYGHVSWERVLSGPGMVNVYHYLRAAGVAPEQPEVLAEMEREDPGVVVVRRGLAETDPLCVRTLDVFCAVYGAQAGNLALAAVATGGVYLAGGIAPRIVERLRAGPFLAAFQEKGRLSGLLSKIPVHVIINPDVGLLGAAAVAGRMTVGTTGTEAT